jgi:hypothetical protein
MAYTTLLYGGPKLGKTTFASHAPGALFLATEPGCKALEIYDVNIQDWKTLLQTLGEVEKGNHQFKTIVIDTIDNAYTFCRDHVCSENGWNDPADAGYGKGFNAVNGEFRRVLLKLASLPYGLIFISHSRDLEVKTRTGTYTRITTTLPDSAAKIIKGLVDVMLFADMVARKTDDGTEYDRVLCTRPTLNYDAGGRFPGIPEVLPLDYDAYINAFQKAMKATKGPKK